MAHSKMRDIAFIGTGIMGAPIVGHLLDAGYRVTVHDRFREKAEALIAHGAVWADTPAAAAAKADVVLTCVGGPEDVEDVYLGSRGVLEAARKGAYLIDLTTSAPQLARELHDAAEVMDKHAFDCAMTGGVAGAIAKALTLLIGADEQYVEPVLPILKTFSRRTYYFGHAGSGQLANLCNHVSFASCMVGWADALALAREGGLDEELLLHALESGVGASAALSAYAHMAVESDWSPAFYAETLHKNLSLALAEAEDLQVTLPGAETSYMLFDTLCQVGGARLGGQALALLYQDEAESTAAGLDWSALPLPEEDPHEHHHHHHH
ncbi:MAG: NAD(P)-dependent oxidoreductase [Coriobacteriales bacterium]|nr:NAD(P)-dependent oxidoreductase [Coriobacteriales bacterium]